MTGDERNPTTRFSDRVENYLKYRPGYPPEVMAALRTDCGLTNAAVIADVGSGTGMLTRPFLENGNRVFAIEPNPDMRRAAEELLGNDPNFTSVPASAEATSLPPASVDFIVAAQAFHWFDRARAKAEFRRILRPGGWIVLVWNEREIGTSPFLSEYEGLLQTHATDYNQINHTNLSDDVFREFYSPGTYQQVAFPNLQRFDFEGLKGRCLSSSYAPNVGQPGHEAMMVGLREIFDRHQSDGTVVFEYRTRVYRGR